MSIVSSTEFVDVIGRIPAAFFLATIGVTALFGGISVNRLLVSGVGFLLIGCAALLALTIDGTNASGWFL
jgi:hypothetical protein